jgi:Right handed beta helix region
MLIPADAGTLAAALRMARAGDTVSLAKGRYSQLVLQAASWRGPGVTIEANGAVFGDGVRLVGCSGLTVRDAEILPARPGYVGVDLADCTAIALERCDIHGDGAPRAYAIRARRCTSLVVKDCRLHEVFIALSHTDGDGILVERNRIHDITGDGVRGHSSRLTVRGNHFARWTYPQGWHADAIQVFTTDRKAAVRDVLIEDNVFEIDGKMGVQGVFFGNEGGVAHERVVVRRNAVVGGTTSALQITHGIDPLIEDNLVLSFRGYIHENGRDTVAQIRLRECLGGRVFDNVATGYSIRSSEAVVERGNVTIPLPSPGDLSALREWRARTGVRTPAGDLAANRMPASATSLAVLASPGRRDLLMQIAARLASR